MRSCSTIALFVLVSTVAAPWSAQSKPESAPPPDHPVAADGETAAGNPDLPPAAADDVETVEAIVAAYYDSLSGAAGTPRDWDRFRSLFLPDARMVTARGHGAISLPISLSPEAFVERNRRYFERGGYFERPLHTHIDRFGRICQVFSTYDARRSLDSPPYLRGINSIQLLRAADRWWIVSVQWEYERPDGPFIPPDFRPAPGADP